MDFKFYFVGHKHELEVAEYLPCKNLLISAYSCFYGLSKKVLKNRQKIHSLFIDSGMLSAWKKKNLEWMNLQKVIVRKLNKLKPNIISHLDLPMEPKILSINKFSAKEALRITLRNATEFLDTETENAIKCFVVQGWDIRDYSDCIEKFRDQGIFDNRYWIGIGTTCMRRPPELYRIYQFCIKKIREINPEQHVHAFGIAKPKWLATLESIGVNSGDSATVSFQMIRRDVLLGDGTTVNLKVRPMPTQMARSLYVINAWSYWIQLNEALKKKKPRIKKLSEVFT